MKELKTHKGITLVALIITIVVLLILAIVAIGAVRDSMIITHAQNAGDSYTIGQEKEQIGLAVSEWQLEKVIPGNNVIFKNVIEDALQKQNVSVDGENDGPLTVTFNKTENVYTVTKDGEIDGPVPPQQPTQGITITPTTLIIQTGETASLTATLNGGLTGTITYTSSDETKATVNSEGIVKGESEGIATITATCGEYSAKCEVTIQDDQIIGIKVYNMEGESYILSPENELRFFASDSVVEEEIVTVNEGIGSWNIEYEGFTDEEKENLEYLSTDDIAFATSLDRNTLYMPEFKKNNTIKFSKTSYATHNEELLAQYYQDDSNVEYYYGKYDDFSPSTGVTYIGGVNLYKVDLNENIITIYTFDSDSSWKKVGNYEITNKMTNPTQINVIVGGKKEIITTNALKFQFLYYGTNIICYIQDNILYNYMSKNFADGVELQKGFDILTCTKYVNILALPK